MDRVRAGARLFCVHTYYHTSTVHVGPFPVICLRQDYCMYSEYAVINRSIAHSYCTPQERAAKQRLQSLRSNRQSACGWIGIWEVTLHPSSQHEMVGGWLVSDTRGRRSVRGAPVPRPRCPRRYFPTSPFTLLTDCEEFTVAQRDKDKRPDSIPWYVSYYCEGELFNYGNPRFRTINHSPRATKKILPSLTCRRESRASP